MTRIEDILSNYTSACCRARHDAAALFMGPLALLNSNTDLVFNIDYKEGNISGPIGIGMYKTHRILLNMDENDIYIHTKPISYECWYASYDYSKSGWSNKKQLRVKGWLLSKVTKEQKKLEICVNDLNDRSIDYHSLLTAIIEMMKSYDKKCMKLDKRSFTQKIKAQTEVDNRNKQYLIDISS